jgi:formylglycine-generating enzyme required for sulfatase activity
MACVRGRSLVIVLGGIGVAACADAPNVAPPLPRDGAGPGDVFQGVPCSAVRPQTEPDLMGWDSGSRANLHKLRQSGVVAVRYVSQGCNVELEVLSNCIGKGSYAFSYYPESKSKTLRSARELFAEIPVSAAQLSGKLKGSRVLRAEYELIGTASLPVGSVYKRAELSGPPAECAKATHVVSTLYLGGFAMVAGEESKLTAKGKVFGVSAGDTEGTSMERIDDAGDAKACAEAKKTRKDTEGCQVPLRIGLLALEDVVQAGTAPGGKSGGGCPEGMVAVPGGAFKMGERGTMVTVAGFCMDLAEVTADAYRACVGAGRCSAEHLGEWHSAADAADTFRPAARRECNYGEPDRGDHPINCVDWNQAVQFCNAYGKRLPAEEEWEWTARGGARGYTYPWGNDAPEEQLCWNKGSGAPSHLDTQSRVSTCRVGSSPSGDSPAGIHDLAGNVEEWTSTSVKGKYVARGGKWYSYSPSDVSASHAQEYKADERGPHTGFRCARSNP